MKKDRNIANLYYRLYTEYNIVSPLPLSTGEARVLRLDLMFLGVETRRHAMAHTEGRELFA